MDIKRRNCDGVDWIQCAYVRVQLAFGFKMAREFCEQQNDLSGAEECCELIYVLKIQSVPSSRMFRYANWL